MLAKEALAYMACVIQYGFTWVQEPEYGEEWPNIMDWVMTIAREMGEERVAWDSDHIAYAPPDLDNLEEVIIDLHDRELLTEEETDEMRRWLHVMRGVAFQGNNSVNPRNYLLTLRQLQPDPRHVPVEPLRPLDDALLRRRPHKVSNRFPSILGV